jgi:GNAT superfamily N-acetyltransferase
MPTKTYARATAETTAAWPHPLAIRPLSEDDTGALGVFLHDIEHPLPSGDLPKDAAAAGAAIREFLETHRNDPSSATALAGSCVAYSRVTGQIFGMCLVADSGDGDGSFRIYDVVLAPTYRAAGLGSVLVQRIIDVLSRHGIAKVQVRFEPGARALNLFTRLGFEPKA